MNNQRRSECSAQGLAASDCNDNVFNGDLKVTPELIRKVKIRATYSCDEESTCYLHPDGLLVCVNLQTGDYTSELGVSGNAITGEFTPASAGTSSVAAEDTPIETVSAESSSSTTVNSKASTVISSSSSPVPTKVSTVTSAGVDAVTQTSATPTQSTAGAGKLSTGTVVGALGLVVGFIL
ncbi:hypothetical protein IFR04_004609 [Cadophora malorum]|uniref:Uncharacterized protein n=1 Tax=Cadophora malorum TaxID=108018 RepID=A0A8H8BS99_9HELO|nr:hypothetical protein IFR04_004609 [Cadophora malorum]